jgi:hypothetical protein
MFSNVWEIHVFFIAVSGPSKYNIFEKTKFYILLIEGSENFFVAIFLTFRHIRMGKNCAHIEKLILFWDTLLCINKFAAFACSPLAKYSLHTLLVLLALQSTSGKKSHLPLVLFPIPL